MIRLVLACALAFGLYGCNLGEPPEKTLLEDPVAAKRAAAADRLGASPRSGAALTKAVDALSEGALDTDNNVRTKAVAALGKLGGDQARAALLDIARGKLGARVALRHFEIALKRSPDTPELMIAVARSRTDLGQLTEAEKQWNDIAKLLKNLEPQQAGRFYRELQAGYGALKLAFGKAGKADDADRAGKAGEQAEAKAKEAEAQNPNGGMFGGGFPGGGFPSGSIPIN